MNKSTWPFPAPNQMGGKKKVHFKHVHYLSVGHGAVVWPVNHPDTENVSNRGLARTSTVQKINEDGSFETLNTIYIPELR